MDYLKSMENLIPSGIVSNQTQDTTNPMAPSDYLPINATNLDPRFFTPEYARMFGRYGALSQISAIDYDRKSDVFGRTVGSEFDAPISASSTLFNYLTVTPGFTKVSSLNYQVYRDAKIQIYTPMRFCDKSDATRDGKVVLDSRGLIASMVPVSENKLPTIKQFMAYQPIDDRNKRVNLNPDEDDTDYEITNVEGAGVYNPNFLFFVKVSDVTPETMNAANQVMTARNSLIRQRNERNMEIANLSKVAQEKDMAVNNQQTQQQEAVNNVLNNDDLTIGDAVTFTKGLGCDGKFYKYAFVANVTQNSNGSKSYGLFPMSNLDYFKYAKQKIEKNESLFPKCTVARAVIDTKVPIIEVEQYFNAIKSSDAQGVIYNEIKVGDFVEIVDKTFNCGGIPNLKYAKVSEITQVGKNNPKFGKFKDAYNLVIFSSKDDFDNSAKRASCVVYDTNQLKRVGRDEVETYFNQTSLVETGGSKHTRRLRKGVVRGFKRSVASRRRTNKGRKRVASKTAKKQV